MTTIKRTITDRVERTIEVELPTYLNVNNGQYIYAILSEDTIICVLGACSVNAPGVEQVSLSNAYCNESVPCTKEEFEAAYIKAVEQLNSIVLPAKS